VTPSTIPRMTARIASDIMSSIHPLTDPARKSRVLLAYSFRRRNPYP
jgi:hypothetical protein